MIGNSQVFGQGESSKTGFFLNPLPDTVIDGEPIKFSGYLLTSDGTPLTDRTIIIKQDISLSSDRDIETTTSDEYGYFATEHSFTLNEGYSKANILFYAKYVNSNNQHYRTLNQNTVLVLSESVKTSVLTIDTPQSNVKFGEPITFSGKLVTESGEAISGKTIVIRDRDSTSGDDVIASIVTDSLGNYSVTVIAQYWDTTMNEAIEVYAVFNSDTNYYTDDSTLTYNVWVSGNVKDTKLIFDSLPKSITSGEIISFSGQLLDDNNMPLAGKSVQINEDIIGSDVIIKTVTTDGNGKFSYSKQFILNKGWKQSGGTAEFFLKYLGDEKTNSSRSVGHAIKIKSSIQSTNLILDKVNIGSANVGDTITFTGKLTSNGNPISGKPIFIKEADDFITDEFLAKGVTNSQGSFSIPWKITQGGVLEIEFDVYAVFEYDGERYYGDQSPTQYISIYKINSSITLDPIPRIVNTGEEVVFTGKVTVGKGDIERYVVYIKDEDSFSSDELLATGILKKDGTFYATWRAVNT
ncbi:MAG: hypothetical protein ACKVHH_08315, partial [Candidatus Poseidoniales archaeon]